MLIIDEIQHLLSGSVREQRAALTKVKLLSNHRRITIVAAGTMKRSTSCDPQIAISIRADGIASMVGVGEVTPLHCRYVAMLPILKNPTAIDQRFVDYSVAFIDGVTGRIIAVSVLGSLFSLHCTPPTLSYSPNT
jgi:Bacterial TniB protein